MIPKRQARRWDFEGHPLANHATFNVVAEPTTDVFTLEQIKRHLRVDYDDDDTLLTLIASAARQRLEKWLKRSLLTMTRELVLDWGVGWVELPYPPVQSVSAVYTTDLADVESAVSTALYTLDPRSATLALRMGQIWPIHRAKAGWRVQYVAGWTSTDTLPAAIQLSLLDMIASAYDTRSTIVEVPAADQEALTTYAIVGPSLRMSKQTSPTDILA